MMEAKKNEEIKKYVYKVDELLALREKRLFIALDLSQMKAPVVVASKEKVENEVNSMADRFACLSTGNKMGRGGRDDSGVGGSAMRGDDGANDNGSRYRSDANMSWRSASRMRAEIPPIPPYTHTGRKYAPVQGKREEVLWLDDDSSEPMCLSSLKIPDRLRLKCSTGAKSDSSECSGSSDDEIGQLPDNIYDMQYNDSFFDRITTQHSPEKRVLHHPSTYGTNVPLSSLFLAQNQPQPFSTNNNKPISELELISMIKGGSRQPQHYPPAPQKIPSPSTRLISVYDLFQSNRNSFAEPSHPLIPAPTIPNLPHNMGPFSPYHHLRHPEPKYPHNLSNYLPINRNFFENDRH